MKLIRFAALTSVLFALQPDVHAQRYRQSYARNYQSETDDRKIVYMGIGTGLDYGGIGVKAEVLPIPYVGIFVGVGYNLERLGVNGGVSFKALPFKRLTPTVQAMYGYNAVIVVKGATQYNKTYFGPSVGAGLDWKLGRNDNKLFFGVYYPIRSSQYQDDLDELKANPLVKLESEPLPVTFTIGFNFAL